MTPTKTRVEEAIRLLNLSQKKSGKDQRRCISSAVNHLIKHLAGKPLTVKKETIGIPHDSDNVCPECGFKLNRKRCFKCEKEKLIYKSKDKTVAEFLEEKIVCHQDRVQKDLNRLKSERAKYSESNE